MKYSNWYQRMNEKHGDDFPAYVEECLHPDPGDFLNHQREQYQKAVEADALDYRYDALLQHTEKAEAALQSGKPEVIAIAFCRLGETIKEFDYPTREEMAEMALAAWDGSELKVAHIERGKHNYRKKAVKEHAQRVASEMWRNDHEQAIRLTDMANQVWSRISTIEDELGWPNVLPDRAEGIKPWLREIAPTYAKKGGRPAK